ncbi:MAG: methylated-DNA--[protein]-cysteine S-methyltransferase [Polyangiaceae bacterium]
MTRSSRLLLDHVATPLGSLALIADEDGKLRAVGWTDGHDRMEQLLRVCAAGACPTLARASNPHGLSDCLRAYFDGELTALRDLRVLASGTAFQEKVWTALCEIPSGETRSYADIARRIAHPSAVRAVGLANRANPVAVVVPCHRVIGADGSLTGYGAGVDRKRWLLEHERGGLRDRDAPASA